MHYFCHIFVNDTFVFFIIVIVLLSVVVEYFFVHVEQSALNRSLSHTLLFNLAYYITLGKNAFNNKVVCWQLTCEFGGFIVIKQQQGHHKW